MFSFLSSPKTSLVEDPKGAKGAAPSSSSMKGSGTSAKAGGVSAKTTGSTSAKTSGGASAKIGAGASTKAGATTAAGVDDTPPAENSSVVDDSTLATPRSVQTKDEFDDPDFNDLMDAGQSNESNILSGVNKFLNKQAKAFVRNFIDYGPPYTKKPFDPALVNECSKPVMNHMELHRLLNNRMNPNLPDPEDLYYYPIHWAARNIHFMALKMLCRAGAQLNVTNELGCTPLDMCVMMKVPPDKRKDQLKMAKYLLEHGADPNNRDKGGFSAIDQAAINQDLEMIQLLLEHGANVLRENHTLVAKRHHILRHVYEPECYRVLYERLIYEQGIAEEKRILREKQLSEIAAERHHVKLHQALDKRKQKRLAREAARDTSAKMAVLMEQRHKHLAEEMENNLKNKEKVLQLAGNWAKDDVDHWTFVVKDAAQQRVNSNSLYADNLRMMNHLRELNSMERYNERWKKATGHPGGLELHWSRADAFTLLPPIPGTPFITDSQLKQQRQLGDGKGRDDDSLLSGSASLGGGSRGGGRAVEGAGKVPGGSRDGTRPPVAEQLQLEHGSRHAHRDAHNRGGILKSSAYPDTGDSSALDRHAFGGMFVGQASGPAGKGLGGVSDSAALITKRGRHGAGAATAQGEGDGIDDPYGAEAQGLPVVDAQYGDSDDEQLFDEDLEQMLREMTLAVP